MLTLTVAAPGGRKLEVQLPPTATFAELKQRIAEGLGAPPDKQRVLCSGKERKDGKETLAAAGVKDKSKLMLMLAPGFTLPPPASTAASESAAGAAEERKEEAPSTAAPVDAHGVLPSSGEAAAACTDGNAPKIHVRHGGNKYHVSVPQGLHQATFAELAEFVASTFLPEKVPAQELRFIRQGKTADGGDKLGAEGAKDASVMLLFFPNFHATAEGGRWLEDRTKELDEAEKGIEAIRRKVDANFADAETALKLGDIGGLIETLLQSLESVKLREARLPAMEQFRERVKAADENIRELRKRIRL